jgi:DNA-binding NarL/FixJ family response regulator
VSLQERREVTQLPGPILVVDDDEGFRTFVAEVLENVGYRTEQLANGVDVLPAAEAERPATVLLDVQLPGLNGYQVCRDLRDQYGDAVPVLFISGERTEALDRAAGLLLGADDYMIKPIDPDELIARVGRLLREPGSNGGAGPGDEKLASLTQREQEVLNLLAEGLQQDEIAHRLVISPKTVATHIQRILGKLDVRSRAQAVAHVLRRQPG